MEMLQISKTEFETIVNELVKNALISIVENVQDQTECIRSAASDSISPSIAYMSLGGGL